MYVSMSEERRVLRIAPLDSCPANLDGIGGVGFGDLTLMLGERRTATVRSREFTETFQLSATDFERIREAYPELREVMSKASKERSDSMAELVVEGVVL